MTTNTQKLWTIWECSQTTGTEWIVSTGGDEAEMRRALALYHGYGRDVWLRAPDGTKHLPGAALAPAQPVARSEFKAGTISASTFAESVEGWALGPSLAQPVAMVDEREAFETAFLSANGFHTKAELAQEWEKGLSGVMFRAGLSAQAAPKVHGGWNADQIGDACAAAGIPDSKYETLLLALMCISDKPLIDGSASAHSVDAQAAPKVPGDECMASEAVSVLVDDGWVWDGDQWQRPCNQQPEAKAQAVPEGWRLVPVEPTDAMEVAGGIALESSPAHDVIGPLVDAWSAMLAAAPQPPAPSEQPCVAVVAGPTCTDVALWRAMNEAEKVGQRYDDKLVRKALNAAGYQLVRNLNKQMIPAAQRLALLPTSLLQALNPGHGIRSTGGEHE